MQLRKYGPPACAGACKEGARGSRLRSASYGGQAATHARRRRAPTLKDLHMPAGRRRSILISA